ncbi:MAG: tetratricopeptide repeat protein [Bacteroidota bacterium]
MNLAVEQNNYVHEGNAYHLLGRVKNAEKKFDQALQYYFRAIEVRSKYNLDEGLAKSYNNVAIIFRRHASYGYAIDFLRKSIFIKEQINFDTSLDNSYHNLGLAYQSSQLLDSAKHYYNKTLTLRKSLNLNKKVASALNDLAIVSRMNGDLEHSIELHKEALKIRREIKIDEDIAASLNNLGFLYREAGDSITAIQYLKGALNHSHSESESDIYYNLALIYQENENVNQAISYLKKAIRSNTNDSEESLLNYFTNLASNYYKSGNHELAVKEYQKADSLRIVINDRKGLLESRLYNRRIELEQIANDFYAASLTSQKEHWQGQFYRFLFGGMATLLLLGFLSYKLYPVYQQAKSGYQSVSQSRQVLEQKLNYLINKVNTSTQKRSTTGDLSRRYSTDLELMAAQLNMIASETADEVLQQELRKVRSGLKSIEQGLTKDLSDLTEDHFVTDLSEKVGQSVAYWQAEALLKGVELNATIQPQIHYLYDSDSSLELIGKLIKYAIESATPESSVLLYFNQSKGKFEFRITDTGKPFSKEDQLQLFNAGFVPDSRPGTPKGYFYARRNEAAKFGAKLALEYSIVEGTTFVLKWGD